MAKQKPEPTQFGKNLRTLRLAAGLTIVQLGEAIGQDGPAISRMETSPNHNPKLSTIQKLAAALGVSPSKLIGE